MFWLTVPERIWSTVVEKVWWKEHEASQSHLEGEGQKVVPDIKLQTSHLYPHPLPLTVFPTTKLHPLNVR